MAAVASTAVDGTPIKIEPKAEVKSEPKSTLTPPTSEEADKHDGSSSELSDLDLDQDDIGEIEPDHYYEGGRIPVFKPTMNQFRSFKVFIEKIDKYGMKSGIVKVIPPKEWRDSLPALDDAVKTIKVKNPISQEFHGSHGTYTQANMEKQRSYNLPQWKALCEESNHQPPARRGERRLNQERYVRGAGAPRITKKAPASPAEGKRKGPGRPRREQALEPIETKKANEDGDEEPDSAVQKPPTPTSPANEEGDFKPTPAKRGGKKSEKRKASPKPKGRQPKSVSQRRMRNSREQVDDVDEEAFEGFDYRIHNQDDWTTERCQELETSYWKSLTFNNPMYGADMPGSLFEDQTTSWNVAHLENLLDVLGQKVPGVNTTYLYLGMWKATFAWHLEDVDLYSINYIHFGAPKQWYSISQVDARRFERAMRNVWPSDSKNCDQFLRHKTYLISPQILKSQFNIEVNRLVHHEGEFVITFPYGYHSGYNLGYNCAESVNFATESWLDYGKVARKCNCEADSVWVDVWDIERKMRGEPTPEFYEETEDDDDDDEEAADLPTPPGDDEKGKVKAKSQKRKRELIKDVKPRKKIMLRMRNPSREPCCLCPNDSPFEELLPTDNGKQAHRRCGEYTPETMVITENGKDIVVGIASIDKARLNLKCNYCRNRNGAVFQCHWKKCVRAYHATCAAPAGVQLDRGPVPFFADDGVEYSVEAFDFRCRFHRTKRPKYVDMEACLHGLENNAVVRKYAAKLQRGDLVQWQYYTSDIFAGYVLENRRSEQAVVVSSVPKGADIEIDHKWLLVLDPAHSLLPLPSEGAKPLPAHLARQSHAGADNRANDMIPRPDDPFADAKFPQKWAEFHSTRLAPNPDTVPANLGRPKSLWYYMGRSSTEAKPQYTGDLASLVNDPSASFLASVPHEVRAGTGAPAAIRAASVAAPRGLAGAAAGAGTPHRWSHVALAPTGATAHRSAPARSRGTMPSQQVPGLVFAHKPSSSNPPPPSNPSDRPYNGKYAITTDPKTLKGVNVDAQSLRNQKAFLQSASSGLPSQIYSGANNGFYQQGLHTSLPPSTMGSTSNGLPSMADVRRRSSHTLQTLEDFRRVGPSPTDSTTVRRGADDGSQYAHSLNPAQPTGQAPSQPQAPVANMGGTNSSTTPTSYSRPSTSHRTPPSSSHSSVHFSRPRSDSFKAIARYPYLLECAAQRPAVYQSPYAPGGGINEAWMSNPKPVPKLRRPRAGSLAQDFLMKRTPSQREAVKGHVRTISTDKAMQQQQEAERRQREQQHQRQQRSLAAASPTSLLPNPLFQPDAFPASPPFADFGPSNAYAHAHPYASLLATNTANSAANDALYASPTTYANPSPSHPHSAPSPAPASASVDGGSGSGGAGHPTNHAGPTGLQFSTPHDFQLQMQREAVAAAAAAQQQQQQHQQQAPSHAPYPSNAKPGSSSGGGGFMTHDRTSYHALVRDLQAGRSGAGGGAAAHPGGSAVVDTDVMVGVEGPGADGGPSGSPLRRGLRAAGGEMLPMMQDPPF